MEHAFVRVQHLFVTAGMAIIICVLFLSCYTLNEFNSSLWVRKNITSESFTRLTEFKTTSGNMKAGEVDWGNNRTKLEYGDMDKYYLNSLIKLFSFSQISAFIICSIILSFLIILLGIRRWLIKVYNSRVFLVLVHFIQLKDGKKDALSFCYIF